MSVRVSYQPIPHLLPSDSAWAWTVSDGTFIVGRFNSREYAESFRATLVGSASVSSYAERAVERAGALAPSTNSSLISLTSEGKDEQDPSTRP